MQKTAFALVMATLAATAGPVLAQQWPGSGGNGGVNYDVTMGNGPGGSTVHMQGTMSGSGNGVMRMCMQPPGAPMQVCRMSINGQTTPTFVQPAMPSGMGSPGMAPPGMAPPGVGSPLMGAPPFGPSSTSPWTTGGWPGAGWGPSYPMSGWPNGGLTPYTGMSPYTFPDQGFEVSGRGRWGPYAARGNFSFSRAPYAW